MDDPGWVGLTNFVCTAGLIHSAQELPNAGLRLFLMLTDSHGTLPSTFQAYKYHRPLTLRRPAWPLLQFAIPHLSEPDSVYFLIEVKTATPSSWAGLGRAGEPWAWNIPPRRWRLHHDSPLGSWHLTECLWVPGAAMGTGAEDQPEIQLAAPGLTPAHHLCGSSLRTLPRAKAPSLLLWPPAGAPRPAFVGHMPPWLWHMPRPATRALCPRELHLPRSPLPMPPPPVTADLKPHFTKPKVPRKAKGAPEPLPPPTQLQWKQITWTRSRVGVSSQAWTSGALRARSPLEDLAPADPAHNSETVREGLTAIAPITQGFPFTVCQQCFSSLWVTSLVHPLRAAKCPTQTLGPLVPHHPTLPWPLPASPWVPPGPPSPHLTRYLPRRGSVPASLLHCASRSHAWPSWLGGSCFLPGGYPPTPRLSSGGRELHGDPTLAWLGASSALHPSWFPGSTSSQLGGLTSLGLSLLNYEIQTGNQVAGRGSPSLQKPIRRAEVGASRFPSYSSVNCIPNSSQSLVLLPLWAKVHCELCPGSWALSNGTWRYTQKSPEVNSPLVGPRAGRPRSDSNNAHQRTWAIHLHMGPALHPVGVRVGQGEGLSGKISRLRRDPLTATVLPSSTFKSTTGKALVLCVRNDPLQDVSQTLVQKTVGWWSCAHVPCLPEGRSTVNPSLLRSPHQPEEKLPVGLSACPMAPLQDEPHPGGWLKARTRRVERTPCMGDIPTAQRPKRQGSVQCWKGEGRRERRPGSGQGGAKVAGSFNECRLSATSHRPVVHIRTEPTEVRGPAPWACDSWPTSQPLGLPDPNDPPCPPEQTSLVDGVQGPRPALPCLSFHICGMEMRTPTPPGSRAFCLYKSGNAFLGPGAIDSGGKALQWGLRLGHCNGAWNLASRGTGFKSGSRPFLTPCVILGRSLNIPGPQTPERRFMLALHTASPRLLAPPSKMPLGPSPTHPLHLVPEALLTSPPSSSRLSSPVSGSSHWLFPLPECPSLRSPFAGCLLRGAFLTSQLKRLFPPQVIGFTTLLPAEAICLIVYVLVVCLPHPHPAHLECQQEESRDKAWPGAGAPQTVDDGTLMRSDDQLPVASIWFGGAWGSRPAGAYPHLAEKPPIPRALLRSAPPSPGIPGSASPSRQACPSSRDNVQRATSVLSLSSISSPESLSVGEGREGHTPPLLCPHGVSLAQAGQATEPSFNRIKPQLERLRSMCCTLEAGGVGECQCRGVPMSRVGMPTRRVEAKVGPCVPRQQEREREEQSQWDLGQASGRAGPGL
ncbi:hypothetical protein Cadr_000017462 [Camelus dromedarius]|uniref:Uncharacterized protein n=1 Tax=Camelus dromedarius TaxID=9838 RepID=A0A5N4DEA1_CAMDR|nr:hypothetical protein Cadr_000017462 [Camelus dromedarius]